MMAIYKKVPGPTKPGAAKESKTPFEMAKKKEEARKAAIERAKARAKRMR